MLYSYIEKLKNKMWPYCSCYSHTFYQSFLWSTCPKEACKTIQVTDSQGFNGTCLQGQFNDKWVRTDWSKLQHL